jgi:ATP-dependent protease HslVU (ClpYQ) peptidase subunit
LTCIAGVVSNGKVYIGADSAGVGPNEELQLRKDSKVFRNGEYLVGVSGSWRANQILKYAKLDPGPIKEVNPFKHLVTSFLPGIRTMDLPENFELLVGFRGRLFHVYGLSQVSEEIADYEACGSGSQVARGSLYTSARTALTPAARIMYALEAAERFCSGVRSPFNLLEI